MVTLRIFLFSCLLFVASARYSEELQVLLRHGGGVLGHFRTSHSGRGILAFTNIPYAEAPVGPLRFHDPVKKGPWTGFLPSNREDIQCPQKQSFNVTSGVEDCLYLNVYKPLTETSDTLPVMLFIHGGGFTVDSGSLHIRDPANILDNDVILVTFNYRLGPLGYAPVAPKSAGLNWGLKDQQMAIEWVVENIGSFGGHPRRITLFGFSAGAVSVGLHMMNQKSKNEHLFQRAIMMSGTPYGSCVIRDRKVATGNSKKLIKLLKCDQEEGDDNLLSCLRNVPLEDIMATAYDFYEWDVDPLAPFGPVIEEEGTPNPFISEDDRWNILDIPLIIGIARDEGAFKSILVDGQENLERDLENRFDEILPSILCYSHYDAWNKRQRTRKIKEFYLEGTDFNWNRDKHIFTRIVSDGLFVSGFDRFLQQRLTSGNSTTLAYLFNYHGVSSGADLFENPEEEINWGVTHDEPLMYLFPIIKVLAPHRIMSNRDLEFGKRYVKMLTNFAASKEPLEEPLWIPATKETLNYLRIGNCNRLKCPQGRETELAVTSVHPLSRGIGFWRELRGTTNSSLDRQFRAENIICSVG